MRAGHGGNMATPFFSIADSPLLLFDFGGLFIDETARPSPSRDGSQWARSNTAIESCCRCIFVEILLFLWSIGVSEGLRGVPGGSQGRPRGVPAACPGVPETCPGVPGASPRVPGACPEVPRDPRVLRGCPAHPWDSFHKDDSVA